MAVAVVVVLWVPGKAAAEEQELQIQRKMWSGRQMVGAFMLAAAKVEDASANVSANA